MSELRAYVYGLDEFDRDGYPVAWSDGSPAIKDLVREQAGNRCVRCGHPYAKGAGRWSRCDARCTHDTTMDDGVRYVVNEWTEATAEGGTALVNDNRYEAEWRILTVHHLDGDKANCRWWNLMAACQRCHLVIQGKVVMDRVWPHEHSLWFRPYVAGYYAWRYLHREITRTEAEARVDELLALEVRQLSLGGVQA